ncbi:class I SAM-dependent methyltransferase [Chloroflexi bacterium TSY]|nr:class I SAM-dependent methyltransferase [Chloroflexi bacterium TSY]
MKRSIPTPQTGSSERLDNIPSNTWRRYLTDYNEGLGLVYERFVLNDFLEQLRQRYHIESVLEAPLYGMAGVSGINDVIFAQKGVPVTMVDDNAERLKGVERIWREDLQLPVNLICVEPKRWNALPFADNSFDLTWEWAALWYIQDPTGLLRELVRTSRNLVFVAMPNNIQVGYWMRKLLIDREFFATHDESWTNIGRIRRILEDVGVSILEQGVLDVPPWPDTVMPANEVLKRLGIRNKKLESQFTGNKWQWSTMAYYMNEEPDLYERVMKYAWLDHARLPWQVKSVWAHHRYLLGKI